MRSRLLTLVLATLMAAGSVLAAPPVKIARAPIGSVFPPGLLAAMMAVPVPNLDWRVAIVDGTGAAMGTSGNPIFTSAAAASGTQTVQGNLTNNNAAPAANNIGVLGAIANAAVPTFIEGDQTLLSETLNGQLRANVQGVSGAGVSIVGTNPLVLGVADSSNLARFLLSAASANDSISGTNSFASALIQYNGTNFDRVRSNLDGVLQTGGVTIVGTTNYDIVNYNGRSLVIHANVTLFNGGTVSFTVQMKDANGLFVNLPNATTGAVAAGADIMLFVGANTWPANATPVFYANVLLPRTFRIVQTVGAASVTFSAAYSLTN